MSTQAHEEKSLGSRARSLGTLALVVGLIGLAAALGLGWQRNDHFARLQHSWLLACLYFLGPSLGALFFVLIQHLTRAGWSVALRRVAELMAANTVVIALLLAPLVVLVIGGDGGLWPWGDKALVQDNPLVMAKSGFLDGRFFAVRCALYFLIWFGLGRWLLSRSRQQDESRDAAPTLALERRAAPAMVLFALSTNFAAFDLLMTLDPAWASTIFGVCFFAASVISFFALAILLLRFLQARNVLSRSVSVEHYHDLGKFLFAFVFFWGYVSFSQFMLIWYADIPEETVWFKERFHGSWAIVSAILLFGHFVLPFAGLLSRHAKRNLGVLSFWAVWMLVMHAVELFWLVMPGIEHDGMLVNPMDVASLLAVGGIWFFALTRLAGERALIPANDPRLPESLAFENS